jgi:hypothetical protein
MRGGPDIPDEFGGEAAALGWGGCLAQESDGLRKAFEEEFGGTDLAGFHAGRNRQGVQGTHVNPLDHFLNPLGLFLCTSIPFYCIF